MPMNSLSKLKLLIIVVSITAGGSLYAQILGDFIGNWNGVENLHSPIASYLNKSISIEISEGGDREGFLIYTSTSDFIYDNTLNWAYHYIGLNKLTNELIFLRRWITPIGTVGFEEIIYNLVHLDDDTFIAEYHTLDSETHHEIIVSRTTLTVDETIPSKVSLNKNYPNPFNPSTTIVVVLKNTTQGSLIIYNIKGEAVKTLHQGILPAGKVHYIWEGRNDFGDKLSGGTYIYRLLTDDYSKSYKMVLLK